jgi:hypothetical protein
MGAIPDGHWVWVDPWGWTWVDDAPWGFAPFHYGRWAFAGAGWVWVPGTMAARPVYAPALVAFVGGPGFGVAAGIGAGVGVAAWFPLGPGEVYRPAYHVSEVYVRQVNITHVTDVTIITNTASVRYVNQGVVGAVTVVPHDAFIGAQPVARAMVIVPQREIVQAQVIGSTAPIAPMRESVLARPVGATAVRTPPARFADRAVFAKTAPPPPPVSFAARQQALQANGGRPLDPAKVESLRATGPGGHPAARPDVVRAPAAGVARPAIAPVRNDRPPAAQTQQANPVARPAEQPLAAPPAQVQERRAEEPKTAKKAVKKAEKKEERKENR